MSPEPWRQLMQWLRPVQDRNRGGGPVPPAADGAVEPGEVALLLLTNALRLLDQSPAPPDIRERVAAAIEALGEHIAGRSA